MRLSKKSSFALTPGRSILLLIIIPAFPYQQLPPPDFLDSLLTNQWEALRLKPKSPQESFYGSYLYDRIVPVDHLLRKINQVVDFSFYRADT